MRGWRWKSRLVSWLVGFLIGLLVVFAVHFILGLLVARRATRPAPAPQRATGCADERQGFAPEEVLRAIQSTEVGVRREMFRRLAVQPGAPSNFYDFARDADYPARADDAQLRFVNLDETPEDEALITFVRWENPVAVVLSRAECGWRVVKILSAWLRFEDSPYRDWLELPPLFAGGRHAILMRESEGDATRYTRNVLVLRLNGGRLERVAEFTEESIAPVEGYAGRDWPEVKERTTRRYAFQAAAGKEPARIVLESKREVVRYEGVAPARVYWGESDGAWHTARAHWRTRPFVTLKTLGTQTERLTWDADRGVFVEEH